MAIDYSTIPLTLKANSNGTEVTLKQYGSPYSNTFQYSLDGGTTWSSYTIDTTITLNQNNTISFKGSGDHLQQTERETDFYRIEVENGTAIVYGNIMSLVNFALNIIDQRQFKSLFGHTDSYSYSNHITDASNLYLPDSTTNQCYERLFRGCSTLTAGPILRATTASNGCYQQIYWDAPVEKIKIDATNSSSYWFYDAFQGNSMLSAIEVALMTSDSDTWQGATYTPSEGIFIRPFGSTAAPPSSEYSENTWTVLNRYNGNLYYANQGDGKTVSYQGDDPFPPTLIYEGLIINNIDSVSASVKLVAIGNPISASFTANNQAYTLGSVINLSANQIVAFSGNAKFSKNIHNRFQFITSGLGKLKVESNLSSLVSSATVEDDYQFNSLFSGCSNIVDASKLTLPKNTTKWCYANMFLDCNNLTAAPQLPATGLNRWCYSSMFGNCSSLLSAPVLLATELAPFSYYCMFYGCENLKDAPHLKASSLTSWCYNSLLYGCSNLSSVYSKNTEWSPSTATSNWVNGVASAGTFSKMTALSAIYGASNIPNNWTIENIDTGPVYEFIPLTFAPINSSTSIALSRISSRRTKQFKYNKNNTGWQDYTFGTAIQLNYQDENNYDYVAFSGDSEPWALSTTSEDSQFNFHGSSNGMVRAYGNIHSLMDYSTLLPNCFRNFLRQSTYISDCSKLWLPLPDGYSVNGLYGSAWRQNSYIQKTPRFRMTDADFANMSYNTLNATCMQTSNLSCIEVCWTTWPNGSASNGNVNHFMYSTKNQSSCIYIKPVDLQLVRRSSSTDGRIPSNWTVLNRMSDGSLQFAENTTWNGNSYSAGDAFPDEDPYADFY